MKRLTRREFLKRLSLGAAGAYVALNAPKSDAQMMGSGTGGGGMGGGASVIDPPPGAAFADPPEMGNSSTVPGIVEVDLEARPAWVNVNGTRANPFTYIGPFPAPTIRAREGDDLKVPFRRSLPMMG